jgi:hypothetical protein
VSETPRHGDGRIDWEAVAGLKRPVLPENIQVRVGGGFALPSEVIAAIGWLALSTAIAYRFGWWLLPAGVGLGLLLAGLGVMLRDGIAGLLMAYYAPAPGAEGSASKPHSST